VTNPAIRIEAGLSDRHLIRDLEYLESIKAFFNLDSVEIEWETAAWDRLEELTRPVES
jgi:hypothetical protein